MSESLPPFDDLLTALAVLHPSDDAARRRIAKLIGFNFPESAATRQTTDSIPGTPLPPIVLQPGTPPPPEPEGPSSQPPARMEVTAEEEVPSLLRRIGNQRRARDWSGIEPLQESVAGDAAPPSIEPLFVPRWMRGVLAAAAATRAPRGPLDLAAIVRIISAGTTFRTIPRRPAPAMARAFQLLVDSSETMLPFTDDLTWMVARVLAVAGRDRTRVLGFEVRKDFVAGTGARFEWTPYPATNAPLPGTAVILLSDLGIGRVPFRPWLPAERWAAMIRTLQKRDATVVAFVPYPPHRWPPQLRGVLPIVHWDPRTTARSVRRIVGRLRSQASAIER